ncbi:MAG: porphobilinogen synthase [Candidatus Auribacterota bacterium]
MYWGRDIKRGTEVEHNRLSKMRSHTALRDLVSETHLHKDQLIMPFFIVEGTRVSDPIKSMPGIHRVSSDVLVTEIGELLKRGVRSVLLFGVSSEKETLAQSAYRADNIAQKSIRTLRRHYSSDELCIITDVCLCGHTLNGHCGIMKGTEIDLEQTLDILAKIAVSHAVSGTDFVAPSAMMDGQVAVIRNALDDNKFHKVKIMSYSVKFASNFYGPFRDAYGSAPQFGDRKTYQMDYRNPGEALREVEQDIMEGADVVMVKPALAYLDIIYRVKQSFNIPLAAYNVSGEYAMMKQYASESGVPEKDLILESVIAMKRAGADMIITYFAKELAQWI